MLSFTENKYACTGCTACYSICPVKCIEMKPDEEGFLYPVASSDCIDCKKCEKVCPIYNRLESNKGFEKYAYAALTKYTSIWRRSTSGGAFSEICLAWKSQNTVYVGAAFNGLDVHHICVNGINNIDALCKSKYVESNLEETFLSLKNHLINEGSGVFCGTPCQVAGLKAYLGKDYEKLLTIDLICHGVGSPKVFKKCVEMIGKQIGVKVKSYEFRAKRNTFELVNLQKVLDMSGRKFYIEQDPYIQLFLAQHCLRPSCGKNCIYRKEDRQGDLTIADFKGLEKVFPNLIGGKRNYSTIVVNTPKGASVMPAINKRMRLYDCTLNDVKEHNPLFYRQTWFSIKREAFFEEFILSQEQTIDKWTEPVKIRQKTIKRFLWSHLPMNIRKWVIKKLINK